MRVDDWDDTRYCEPDLEREPIDEIEEVSPLQPCPTCGWHIDFDPRDFKLCPPCGEVLHDLIWRVLDPPHSEVHDEYDSYFDRGSLDECVDRDAYGVGAR